MKARLDGLRRQIVDAGRDRLVVALARGPERE